MISRRTFITGAGAGLVSLWAGNAGRYLGKALAGTEKEADLVLSMEAAPRHVQIFRGKPTPVWSYRGRILRGSESSLTHLPDSYLGPIVRVRKGMKVRVQFINRLPEESIIHWHGLHVPSIMDGHPRLAVPGGGAYVYDFQVINRAGTYWYHPHPHGTTGPQVYGGLAGLFLVTDPEEDALGLPEGEFEIPLVIQDRSFYGDNRLAYLSGGMMTGMVGMHGDTILVNGHPDYVLSASARPYRLRILNGSNARIYRLAWSDGTPLTIIGVDGGLLEKPIAMERLLLAPGERVDLWADFGKYPSGANVRLVSLPVSGSFGTMMGGRGRNRERPFTIMSVKIGQKAAGTPLLPERLASDDRIDAAEAVNLSSPKRFRLAMSHMRGTINGRIFDMNRVSEDEIVSPDSVELWEFDNTGPGMMSMPHPMHIHGLQFRVAARMGRPDPDHLDAGWKDTVLVMPGERVQLLVKFPSFTGLYMYHCHNLEHEDMGMMRNYLIRRNA